MCYEITRSDADDSVIRAQRREQVVLVTMRRRGEHQ
jgi:hypothetical protein